MIYFLRNRAGWRRGQEHVQEIPLEELHPFEGHPFKVLDNEEMDKTVESVSDARNCYAADRTP